MKEKKNVYHVILDNIPIQEQHNVLIVLLDIIPQRNPLLHAQYVPKEHILMKDLLSVINAHLELILSLDKNIVITNIVRFEVGEGIAKKEENFAEEVAKQMAGN